MDDITHRSTPEWPESRPADSAQGSYLTPWSVPSAGAPETPEPPQRREPETESRRHISTGVVAFISAVLGAAAVVGILALLGLFSTTTTETIASPSDAAVSPPTTVIQQVTTEIIADGGDINVAEAIAVKVLPSVVTVEVGDLGENDLEETVLTLTGSGSGVILQDGFIVTNHHVIADSTVSRIVLQDGRTYDTEVVGSDPHTDLAVLKVDLDSLPPIDFGSTDDVTVGQFAVAVGNPLGQIGGASLTTGVISALSRTVQFGDQDNLYGMLQTDAPITSGSSGGALVDAEGDLIGITSAIGVGRGGAEGIGYAIPVELVQRITDEIIETGAVRHSFLGIYGADYVESADDGALTPSGAEIARLWDGDEGSAAADAGFIAQDVIVSVEGIAITTMEDLVVELRLYHVGDEIKVTVLRNGESITAALILDERPEDPAPIVDEETSDDG